MKLIWNFGLALLLFIAGTTTMTAQEKAERKSINPQERAQKQTARMQEMLDLDEAQTAKIQVINAKYAEQKAAMRAEAEKNKEDRKAMYQAQDEELKAVLNKEQLEKYEAQKAARKAKHGKRGHHKRGMKSEAGVEYSRPKAHSERMTVRMQKSLDLTPEQTDQVRALNFKYAKRMEAHKLQHPEATREDMRAAKKANSAEFETELNTILTKDQQKKWQQLQAERKEKRGKKVD